MSLCKEKDAGFSYQQDKLSTRLLSVFPTTWVKKLKPRLQASCLNCNIKGRCSRQARKTGCETSIPNTPYTASTVTALDQVGSLKSEQRKGDGAEPLLTAALIPLAAPVQAWWPSSPIEGMLIAAPQSGCTLWLRAGATVSWLHCYSQV